MRPKGTTKLIVAKPPYRFVRPARIVMKFIDPFDGTWLGTSDYYYDPRMCAAGFYTRAAKAMRNGLKSIQAQIIQTRTPRILLTFQFHDPSSRHF